MFLSFLLTLSTLISAEAPLAWKYKKISSQFSKTPSKIAEFKTQYPELFEEYEDMFIKSVTIEKGTYTFSDPTLCPANDPRLKLTETFIRYICYIEDEEGEICEDYDSVEMPDIDPCSELFKNNQ